MTEFGFRMKFKDDELGAIRRAIIYYCEEGRRRERVEPSYYAAHSETLRRFRSHMSQQHKWERGCTIWGQDLSALETVFASYLDLCRSKMAEGEAIPFKCDKRLLERVIEEMWDQFKEGHF